LPVCRHATPAGIQTLSYARRRMKPLMTDPSTISYGSAAAIYGLLTLLLVWSWRRRLAGALLAFAALSTVVWAVFLALQSPTLFTVLGRRLTWFAIESLRFGAWLGFLVTILYVGRRTLRAGGVIVAGIWIAATSAGLLATIVNPIFLRPIGENFVQISALLVLSILSLLMVEQLYRNTPPEHLWSIKHLVLALTAVFALDLIVFADGLLYGEPDPSLWNVRGAASALVAPLMALSASRAVRFATPIFVSRKVVFYSTGLTALGVLLIVIALGGYYMRNLGGSWANFLAIVTAFSALVLVFTVAFSKTLRARARVFLEKHFFRNKYDYRQEWLSFTERLAAEPTGTGVSSLVIEAMAPILECKSGLLWEASSEGGFLCTGAWNQPLRTERLIGSDPLIDFLTRMGWVIDVSEYAASRSSYPGLELPRWLDDMRAPWLIVPLLHEDQLVGVVMLCDPLFKREINWEDRDLLRTAGRAAATHLQLQSTSQELAEARQFDAFYRTSAFVVHDLKNVVAQLELVSKNAGRHKHNPEFIDDAVRTIESAVERATLVMNHLRRAKPIASESAVVSLNVLLGEVVERCSNLLPRPRMSVAGADFPVRCQPERLANVLEHLVRNGQEATPDDGQVNLSLSRQGEFALLQIEDTGSGMDAAFIQDGLFEPFVTTKGNAGLGVGVYDAREYLRELGGGITVSSRPGEGTAFSIRLPLFEEGEVRVSGDRVASAGQN
jgi:putative PEP-CTERM system histidine kinase